MSSIIQRYRTGNLFPGVYILQNFPPFGCKGSKSLPKFWSAKGIGLKVPNAHIHIFDYIGVPPPLRGGHPDCIKVVSEVGG